MLSELDVVRKNMDIMSDIMNENEPGKESPEDLQLLDVSGVCVYVLWMYLQSPTVNSIWWVKIPHFFLPHQNNVMDFKMTT